MGKTFRGENRKKLLKEYNRKKFNNKKWSQQQELKDEQKRNGRPR